MYAAGKSSRARTEKKIPLRRTLLYCCFRPPICRGAFLSPRSVSPAAFCNTRVDHVTRGLNFSVLAVIFISLCSSVGRTKSWQTRLFFLFVSYSLSLSLWPFLVRIQSSIQTPISFRSLRRSSKDIARSFTRPGHALSTRREGLCPFFPVSTPPSQPQTVPCSLDKHSLIHRISIDTSTSRFDHLRDAGQIGSECTGIVRLCRRNLCPSLATQIRGVGARPSSWMDDILFASLRCSSQPTIYPEVRFCLRSSQGVQKTRIVFFFYSFAFAHNVSRTNIPWRR